MKTPHYAQEAKLPWATVDLHCHTTLSDGCKTARELVSAAIDKAPVNAGHVELLAVTDHDAINDEAVALLKKEGIATCEAVEISACDYEGGRHSLHLTYYARKIGREVRDALAGIRSARVEKIRKQCALLATNGFLISFADMEAEAARRGMSADCLNNKNLAEVVLRDHANRARAAALAGEPVEGESAFIGWFLKRDSRMPGVGCAPVADYEPSVEECGRLARKEGGLLAVAHPNFTYEKKGVAHFLKRLERFAQLGVRGVELNAAADGPDARGALGNGPVPENWPEGIPPIAGRSWQNAVRWGAKKNGLLERGLFLTYGSDWHGDDDARHAPLGEVHPSFYDGSVAAPRCLLDRVNKYRRDFLKALDA